MDKEELRQCPYDPNHKVRSCRFEIHILKCQKNNEKKTENKVLVDVCPFNSKHQVPRPDYRHHLVVCPDRFRINVEKETLSLDVHSNKFGGNHDEVVPNFKDEEEDWDKEAKMTPLVPQGERINPAYSYARLSKKERKEFNKQLIEDYYKKQNQVGLNSGFW